MKITIISSILLLGLSFSSELFAEIKFNTPTILARSNVKDSFNLPPLTYLANVAPVINNRGEVAFKVMATGIEGVQGIWIKGAEDIHGKLLYTAPIEWMVTDPSLNEKGLVSFSLFDELKSDGPYILDVHSLKLSKLIDTEKYDLDFYTYPTLTYKNEIFFRGTNKNNDRQFYLLSPKNTSDDNSDQPSYELNEIFSEGSDTEGLRGSYLFRPSINRDGMMVFKMRLGAKGAWDETNPDVIAYFNPFGKKGERLIKIAVDQNYDSKSHYTAFMNSPSISNANHIAFSALTDDGRIGVFLFYPYGETRKIVIENEDDVLNVETFSVKVNVQGHVLFRGKDKSGKRSIFFYDGEKLTKLIKEGDEIPADHGMARILDNSHFPGLSGEVDLNDNDQIVFGAVLQSARDNKEWGNGIYLINPRN